VFNEEIVATQNSSTQKGVVVVEDGETYSYQQRAKLEVYLG
jgi:hypothetical protein